MPTSHVRPIPGIPQTVNELLVQRAQEIGDAEILIDRNDRLTVGQLNDLVGRWASALVDLGVQRGDRVAASLPNGIPVVLSLLATLRIGAVWVGINRIYAAPEKAFSLRDAGVKVLFATPDIIESLQTQIGSLFELAQMVDPDAATWSNAVASAHVREPVVVDPFELAAIAYTSGTTGVPKGAMHSHRNLLLPGVMIGEYSGGRGVTGVYLPLTVLNLQILGPIGALINKGTCVCIDRVDAVGLVEWIEREKVESLNSTAATFHDVVLRDDITPEQLASLRILGVGGSGVPEWLRPAFEKKFGWCFATGYGLSEAPTTVTRELVEKPHRAGSSGLALKHLLVEIVDEDGNPLPSGEAGEVVVGAAITGEWANVYTPFLGYWNNELATKKTLRNNKIFTGDIGWLDEEGELHIEDRRVDLIIRGGANIYPAEIERILNADDRIIDSAVVGRDDARLGQLPVVFVQLAKMGTMTTDDILILCSNNLAKFKVPVDVVFVEEFPRNHMGKILRPELRDRVNKSQ